MKPVLKDVPTFVDNGGRHVHPRTCGSKVAWRLGVGLSEGEAAPQWTKAAIFAEVSVHDCNRQVTWFGYGPTAMPDMVEKIDAAIKELQAAKRAFQKAKPRVKKALAAAAHNVKVANDQR